MTNKEKANVSYSMLNDIVEHFGNNPDRRCIDKKGRCKYTPKSKYIEGNIGCAIGMYLDWEVAKKLDTLENSTIKGIFNKEKYRKLLPEWMQEIDVKILYEMQLLHDDDGNWNDCGLNFCGKKTIKIIKKLIKNTYKH